MTTPESLAALGLHELEQTLRSEPPPGSTSKDVAALFDRHRHTLTESLAGLIDELHQTQVGPWIVLARVEQEQVPSTQGRFDLGEHPAFTEEDKPVSLVWGRGDFARNTEQASAYAEREGYLLFMYPPDEPDPLGRAKLDVMVRVSSEAYRALASIRPTRIARLRRVIAAGDAGIAPHVETTDRATLAAWTRELTALADRGLVANFNGWRWRITALGRRVVAMASAKTPRSKRSKGAP